MFTAIAQLAMLDKVLLIWAMTCVFVLSPILILSLIPMTSHGKTETSDISGGIGLISENLYPSNLTYRHHGKHCA